MDSIQVFKILCKTGIIKLSKYVGASIVQIISAIIFTLIQSFVWRAIVNNSSLFEYDFYQMISYIVLSQVISHIYPSEIGKQLSGLVRTGDILLWLLKPISITKQLLFENIGVSIYKCITISLPIYVVGLMITMNNLYVYNILGGVTTLLISYFIYMLIDLLFGVFSFYTNSVWGINSLKYITIAILSGRFVPLQIYPEWAKQIINMLPFKYLYNVPLQIFINQKSNHIISEILNEIIWLFVIYVVYKVCYKLSIKKVTIQGG